MPILFLNVLGWVHSRFDFKIPQKFTSRYNQRRIYPILAVLHTKIVSTSCIQYVYFAGRELRTVPGNSTIIGLARQWGGGLTFIKVRGYCHTEIDSDTNLHNV